MSDLKTDLKSDLKTDVKTEVKTARPKRRPRRGAPGAPDDLARRMRAVHCPVLVQAERTRQAAVDLDRALRKLRRDMRRCEHCRRATPGKNGAAACPLSEYWNAVIHAAIQEVVDEWESA